MSKRLVQQLFVESAIALFEEYGYENVTIDDIAIHCNKTRTCFYHYFKSKEDLFLHLSRAEKDNYLKILRGVDDLYPGRPDKRLKHLLTSKMRLLYKSSFFKVALTNHLFEAIPELYAIREDFDQKNLEQYIRTVEEGIRFGFFIPLEKVAVFFEFYQKMQKGLESTLFEELDEDTFFTKYNIASELAVKALLLSDANSFFSNSDIKELSLYPDLIE